MDTRVSQGWSAAHWADIARQWVSVALQTENARVALNGAARRRQAVVSCNLKFNWGYGSAAGLSDPGCGSLPGTALSLARQPEGGGGSADAALTAGGDGGGAAGAAPGARQRHGLCHAGPHVLPWPGPRRQARRVH